MFLHFPVVIKHAAVTKFTAVTAAMCHESVTERDTRDSVTTFPHYMAPQAHSSVPSWEYPTIFPQPFIPPRPCLTIIITQPLQEKFVHVPTSPDWN